jgi:hypothetical protein
VAPAPRGDRVANFFIDDLQSRIDGRTPRRNLTMRMSMRRSTRPTNAFSKKLDSHVYAAALSFVFYASRRLQNFEGWAGDGGRLDRQALVDGWSMENVVALIDVV